MIINFLIIIQVYYETKMLLLVFGGVGVLYLVSSRFWIPQKRDVKELLIGIFGVSLCICSLCYRLYIFNDLKISVYEGEFSKEYRVSKSIMRMQYWFSNEEGLKPTFYLDIPSKKEIYPAEFEKGVRYRIYYEDRTSVIVKVEKLE